jgi:hypothetical protein
MKLILSSVHPFIRSLMRFDRSLVGADADESSIKGFVKQEGSRFLDYPKPGPGLLAL